MDVHVGVHARTPEPADGVRMPIIITYMPMLPSSPHSALTHSMVSHCCSVSESTFFQNIDMNALPSCALVANTSNRRKAVMTICIDRV